MKSEVIYDKLDQFKPEAQQRQVLAAYLREQLDLRNEHHDQSHEIAYHIAGLLSTTFAQSLHDDDPYLAILLIAGQLELPDRHHGTATWAQLEELIKAL
jgi:hypothetical protein